MALLSELIQVCARHRVDSEPTLTLFGRRLREAGRISTAGRGRGAAHMTYLDAARFLIACAATDRPEQAADAEFVFSNLVRDDAVDADADFPLEGSEFPTLDTALAEVLRSLAVGEVRKVAQDRWRAKFPTGKNHGAVVNWLTINRSGAGAVIRLLKGEYAYRHPALLSVMKTVEDGGLGQPATKIASDAFERETHRFRTGKNLTAQFNGDLLESVAQLVAGGSK